GKSGVTVSLTGGTPSSPATSTTDANGAYTFTGLPAGSYSIDYTVSTGYANTGTRPLPVTLTAGQNATGNNFFEQERDASIAGYVYDDINGNGGYESGEPGKSGVTVSLTGGTPDQGTQTTTTNSNGVYNFTG